MARESSFAFTPEVPYGPPSSPTRRRHDTDTLVDVPLVAIMANNAPVAMLVPTPWVPPATCPSLALQHLRHSIALCHLALPVPLVESIAQPMVVVDAAVVHLDPPLHAPPPPVDPSPEHEPREPSHNVSCDATVGVPRWLLTQASRQDAACALSSGNNHSTFS